MAVKKSRGIEDVLHILCDSVKGVLSTATGTDIRYSPMIQKTNKICLKPDIGCFVVFSGGFSGLVVMNFSADSAMEIYQNYFTSMGMPEEDLAILHTSDEVGDSLGELMNQCIGNFQNALKKEFRLTVNQNQPKMIVLTQELLVAINARIDAPQYRKVSFETEKRHPFYVELAMEKTEFLALYPFKEEEEIPDVEALIAEGKINAKEEVSIKQNTVDEDFMKELGL
ncbi:MAG: DUF3334 family protein [Thermodesulfobacteriota bacterium]|nr:DUF3334 family protein [Thermodesulfobacteriota bacterium]